MKWLTYQLHWLLGITVGLVLAVMGFTGAMMSYEDEIMDALSHGVTQVAPRSSPVLTPDEVIGRFMAQEPGAWPTRVTMYPVPGGSPRIIYELPPEPGAKTRSGETDRVYVDPYDGRILGKATGEEFFEDVRLLHRYMLVPGNAKGFGRHITGVAAFSMIFFAISGIYLRWPRRALDWKAWLKPDLSRRGRNLYWSLHSVAGTWLFLIYLTMALTGLTWSYPWYQNLVSQMLTGKPGLSEDAAPAKKAAKPAAPTSIPKLDIAWREFQRRTPAGASQVIIPIPKSAKAPVKFRYLDMHPPHYRAVNEMAIDGRTGEVKKSTLYATDPLGEQIMAGMLSVHRGAYFGPVGAFLFMIAGASAPLFTVTGYLLYLDRRRKKGEARRLAREAADAAPDASEAPITIAFASQSGVAEQIAWRSANALIQGGRNALVRPLGGMTRDDVREAGTLLVIASTYGAGEPPDPARAFARKVLGEPANLIGLRYAVLALGHHDYPDFCGFGRSVDAWLESGGGTPLFDRVEVDAEDQIALAQWGERLTALGATASDHEWEPERPTPWRLVERRLLNPGSPGEEAWHVALEPREASKLDWAAGDIAEISPRQPGEKVEAFLAALKLDGARAVSFGGQDMSLSDAVARSETLRREDACAEGELLERLKPLAHRDYSIACLPSAGRLELLVRQTVTPSGRLGMASGWLTHHAPLGTEVDVRVRTNPGFHPPAVSGRVILIGAGTGLAGLRAHIHHRMGEAPGPTWLIFGERSAATDRLHGEEVSAWHADGVLARCDLVFSRDSEPREYVQHRIGKTADELREWVVDHQAAILVCGGLDMAHGVDEALADILGREHLEAMAADGRYRRDVY